MFGKDGPTLIELLHQALCSTERGYDLLAPKFDATPFRTPDEILGPSVEAIGDVDAAVDLCCGTGAAMQFLRPHCRVRLAGLDFSQGMLAQAERRFAESTEGIKAEFVRGDVFEGRFDEEFDLVTCFGALGHILPEDEQRFIGIVRRALKPGGQFVFVTGYRPSLLSPGGFILRTFNVIMRVRNALLKPPFIMYYLTFMLPDVEPLLVAEGFEVEVRDGVFAAPLQRFKLVVATLKP